MNTYNVWQWLLFFFIYCFVGWIIESTYVSLKSKKIVNRGFLRGPYLPLYGSGAIMMLVVSAPFLDNGFFVFLSGVVGATVLEYFTGVTMEALFKVRYWDYSDEKFNFQGHVCLGTSLAWGVLTVAMTDLIHKPVEYLVLSMHELTVKYIAIAIFFAVFVDFAFAFKAAIDLRDLLIKMEKAKKEFILIQKRLDVMIAVLDDVKTDFMEGIEDKVHSIKEFELLNSLEEKFEKLKDKMQLPDVYREKLDGLKEEVADLTDKFKNRKDILLLKQKKGRAYRKQVFLGNPMLKSRKYNEALEELKNSITDKLSFKKTEQKTDDKSNQDVE